MEGTDRVSISRKDLYCIARLLQSEKYAHEPFAGCKYCKQNCSTEKELLPNYERVLFRLQDMTGVYFGVAPMSTTDRLKNEKSRSVGDCDF